MGPTSPDGYLALPSQKTGPGVLVLHAWWGLNDTMRGVCDRLANAGYVAFAPDLYHGQVADTIAGAEVLGSALDANHLQARSEIAAAVRFLDGRTGFPGRGLAVVAFSLGAYYALDLSAAQPETIRSVVLFYGTGSDDFSRSKAAFLGHFAEDDPYEPRAGVDELEAALRSAGRPVTFHHYPGTGHWFLNPAVRTPSIRPRPTWPGNAPWPFCASRPPLKAAACPSIRPAEEWWDHETN